MKLKYVKDPDLSLIADLKKGWQVCDNGVKIRLINVRGKSMFEYDSLEDFNKEWVTLKEPLLKGDFRLAIKVWLDYCNAKPNDRVSYYELSDYSRLRLFTKIKEGSTETYYIELKYKLMALKDSESYTVKELVGD